MKEIAISEFKAKCLALLEQVSRTKQPIRVTRRGKAVAEVVPASPAADKASWLGCLAGSGEIVGDIISPVMEETDWEAARE